MTNSKHNPQVTQWQTAKFYLKQYQKQHPLSWLTYVGWVVGSVMTWMIPGLIVSSIISSLQAGESVNYPLEISKAVACVVVGELITRLVFHFLSIWQVRAADATLKDGYARLLDKSLSFHSDRFAGTVATKINKLASGEIGFTDTLHFNVAEYVGVLLFTVYVIGQDGILALAGVVVIVVLYMTIAMPLVKERLKLVELRTRAESKRTGDLIDGITNIAAVKSYAHEEYERRKFNKQVDTAGNLIIRSWLYNVWRIDPVTVVFYILLAYGPLLYLTAVSDGQVLDGGRIFIVYTSLIALGRKIWDISRTWRNIERHLAEGAEGLEILAVPQGVVDTDGAAELSVPNGEVMFADMGFSYEGAQLYRGFNLQIQPGQKIGLVGPSGGGKTTLVKLLLRFMDIDSGAIRIDNQNIAEVTQQSLRENISYIPQEPLLFHRTLRENILYGNLDASESEMIAAAKKAHAHDFIAGLPQGYDTMVGERGIKLSGGQRQRVAIARAFLKDAPVLVLDEATSALDSESEQLIQDALKDLMQGRTVISIAHRLSTLMIMDKLVVIEEGRISQQDTHEELLKAPGTYARLWSHQSGDYISE